MEPDERDVAIEEFAALCPHQAPTFGAWSRTTRPTRLPAPCRHDRVLMSTLPRRIETPQSSNPPTRSRYGVRRTRTSASALAPTVASIHSSRSLEIRVALEEILRRYRSIRIDLDKEIAWECAEGLGIVALPLILEAAAEALPP